jgi:predicted ABC-type ATPase
LGLPRWTEGTDEADRSANAGHTRNQADHPVSGASPRIRVFAGPNGSGKSVLKSYLLAIVSRYHRSLVLLSEAIKHTSRTYIFDNSTDSADRQLAWVAEITDGQTLELKPVQITPWFKRAVMDKAT